MAKAIAILTEFGVQGMENVQDADVLISLTARVFDESVGSAQQFDVQIQVDSSASAVTIEKAIQDAIFTFCQENGFPNVKRNDIVMPSLKR